MSRFLVAMFVGVAIATAVSTLGISISLPGSSRSLTEHPARPSASYLKGRSRISMRRCIHRGGWGLVAKSHGAWPYWNTPFIRIKSRRLLVSLKGARQQARATYIVN